MTHIVSIDPLPNIQVALKKIRKQLKVNLAYAKDGPLDMFTLSILQTHIEDQLKEIERHSGLEQTPYG